MSKVIIPVKLDELSDPSEPAKSMWVAVPVVDGKVMHDDIDYGYRSLKELLTTYKNEKIIGLKKNRKDAELEEARDIAEDALGVLLTEDDVLLHVEGELNLPDGAIKKAYNTLQKARRAERTKSESTAQELGKICSNIAKAKEMEVTE